MNNLFKKRMKLLSDNGSVGEKLVIDSNTVEEKTFKNDMNYRVGTIYDWDLHPLEEVEFKFEKIKTFSFERSSIEYMVRFKPNYNPESRFKEFHFRNDGKERLGLYLDVYDYSKQCFDKWLIVGKDDRVAYDRYNVLKCNWVFEWVKDGKYHSCLGVGRDANDSSFNSTNSDKIGGTRVSGTTSFILPYNIETSTIFVGDSFIYSDNISFPQVFKVNQMKDSTTLGVIRYYTKQELFNKHHDYVGVVNNKDIDFTFETPIPDLPLEYGGEVHMICNAINEYQEESSGIEGDLMIKASNEVIYINGSGVMISCNHDDVIWHFTLDGIEYNLDDLADYVKIDNFDKQIRVKVINKDLAKYKLGVFYQVGENNSDSVQMEIKL